MEPKVGFEPTASALPRRRSIRTSYNGVVLTRGFEPPLDGLSDRCLCRWATSAWPRRQDSNLWPPPSEGGALFRLSYVEMERMTGLEPAISCLEGRRPASGTSSAWSLIRVPPPAVRHYE